MFSSNKWHKKEGSPSSFRRKRQLISLNSSVFIENLPSFERARARARANHAKIDAQQGCAMQLNGITLSGLHTSNSCWPTRVGKFKLVCVNDVATCLQAVGEKLARIETSSIFRQQFANMLLCRSHTPI